MAVLSLLCVVQQRAIITATAVSVVLLVPKKTRVCRRQPRTRKRSLWLLEHFLQGVYVPYSILINELLMHNPYSLSKNVHGGLETLTSVRQPTSTWAGDYEQLFCCTFYMVLYSFLLDFFEMLDKNKSVF